MKTPQYLDKISDELFNKHSLEALVILIDSGDELDFHYKNISYGINWYQNRLELSSSKSEKVQTFKNTTDLIINGIIDEKRFMDIWDEIVLDFL